MATVRDVVTWALRKLTVIPVGVEPSSDELADGVASFNDMIAEWASDGLDLGLSELTANDVIDVDAAYMRGIRYSLAEDIAAEYGVQVPPEVSRRADRGRQVILASLFTVADLTRDPGMPTRNLANDYYG